MTKKFQDIFTPDWMVNEILDHIPFRNGDKVLEPTAGDGNMAECILKKCDGIHIELTCNEIQKPYCDMLSSRLSKYGTIKKETINMFNLFFK